MGVWLMRLKTFGGVALAAIFLAASAPSALAQQQGTVQVNKQMVAPMNEARAAIVAKDFATAKTKLDQASGFAKTPNETLLVEQLRVSLAANTNDWASLVASVNAIEATNLLSAADMKAYKAAVPEAYNKLGDKAKAQAATRAYLDQYGGTAEQYYGLALDLAKSNDNATAITYANKAIEAASASGKAPEAYYQVLLLAHKQANEMDKYYAVEEKLLAQYPAEKYWRDMIVRVQSMPTFGASDRLDMFRAMTAAGVRLQEKEAAFAAAEADPNALKDLKDAKALIKEDKANLAKDTPALLKKGNASALASTGEAFLTYGDNDKAIELLQKALAGGLSGAEADSAKLHLGIAQYRAGQADAARITWEGVTPGGVAGILAHNWTLISNLKK
jgi:hypothetical protein